MSNNPTAIQYSFDYEKEKEAFILKNEERDKKGLQGTPLGKLSPRIMFFILLGIIFVIGLLAAFFIFGRGDKDLDVLRTHIDLYKPASDTREYRSLALPNGLQVLCISDPESSKSSAALSVQAGSYEDPDNLPGLAHFIEHLTFLGSEKYQDMNTFINC